MNCRALPDHRCEPPAMQPQGKQLLCLVLKVWWVILQETKHSGTAPRKPQLPLTSEKVAASASHIWSAPSTALTVLILPRHHPVQGADLDLG